MRGPNDNTVKIVALVLGAAVFGTILALALFEDRDEQERKNAHDERMERIRRDCPKPAELVN
jgi:hypothetical protein